MRSTEQTEFAPAKINLTLNVLGRRADGYHELESLVVFAGVGDQLTARPADEWSLEVVGPFAKDLASIPPDQNLILKAASLVSTWAAANAKVARPLSFRLEKNLPIAAGVGGGSAGAAAALRLCAQMAVPEPDQAMFDAAASLGADVPVCLLSRPTWMSGIGDQLSQVEVPETLPLVLVNPMVQVPTAAVFQALSSDDMGAAPERPDGFHDIHHLAEFLRGTSNDLQAAAMILAPAIEQALGALDATGPLLARMSGSGSTCFGLYADENEAARAAATIAGRHPDWWITAA